MSSRLQFIQRAFLGSAAVLLILGALLKFAGLFEPTRVHETMDPLLPVSTRTLMVVAALLELGIAAFLIAGRDALLKSALLAWLSIVFAAYHAGLSLAHVGGQCSCLGPLFLALPFAAATIQFTLKAVIAYLAGGSCLLLGVQLVRFRAALRRARARQLQDPPKPATEPATTPQADSK